MLYIYGVNVWMREMKSVVCFVWECFLVFMCQKRSVISMNHACHVIMYRYIYIHVYTDKVNVYMIRICNYFNMCVTITKLL